MAEKGYASATVADAVRLARSRKTFARSGAPVPPDDALFVLAVGMHELACSSLRAGRPLSELEATLVGCAVRLAAEEEPWT